MEWIKANLAECGAVIYDNRITKEQMILVTYETRTGRRYVKETLISGGGRVRKNINGKIVAWMPFPEPYKGAGPNIIKNRVVLVGPKGPGNPKTF